MRADIALFNIDFRYKEPFSNTSQPLSLEILDPNTNFQAASEDTRFYESILKRQYNVFVSPSRQARPDLLGSIDPSF